MVKENRSIHEYLESVGDFKKFSDPILQNQPMVIRIAREFLHHPGIDLMDLVQEGTLGLMWALERYDPKNNVKFGTYAARTIRHFIYNYLNERVPLIKIPRTMAWIIRYIRKHDELPPNFRYSQGMAACLLWYALYDPRCATWTEWGMDEEQKG